MRGTRAHVGRDARRRHNDAVTVNRLPDELIVEIFKQGLYQSNEDTERYLAMLLAICSLWRQIALTTKTVSIALDVEVSEEIVAMDMLKQYLQRAGERTIIDLHLTVRLEASRAMTQNLISVILEHIHRTRTLICGTSIAPFMDAIFPLAGHFPSLEILDVCLVRTDLRATKLLGRNCVAPLKKLTLDGNLEIQLTDVQTEPLIRLDIFTPPRCPHKVHPAPSCDISLPEVTAPIHLPRLARLTIGSPFPLPSSLISAPQLQHLRIFDRAGTNTADVVPANFEQLRSAEIVHIYSSPDHVIRFLRAHKKLVAVTLVFDRALPILKSLVRRYVLEREVQVPLGLLRLRTEVRNELGSCEPVLRELLQSLPGLHLDWDMEDPNSVRGISDLMSSFPGRVSRNWTKRELAMYVQGLLRHQM
ncbi:hypothetical protein BS47DRAFT_1425105 [Hydnum rufescens UP504]|uniref:F-box domain-containing protein n=1 Tax=Hydnum rufescens UP504 TaxID=1448309 RepID=A0A9P6B5M2_9AGAM|nr:hypothetical protein BS47DRAFT_1425105 [Hydnum rufescens UP504]